MKGDIDRTVREETENKRMIETKKEIAEKIKSRKRE